MIYGSVCSGIEAATASWKSLDWKSAWFSEIEKFPCEVLRYHYPKVLNLGDMTKLYENKTFLESPIDLLVGGTPCQSFSVAGLRKGLDDPRGNLCLEFLRLVDIKRPRWFVWENVPGVLSSSNGRDFGSFIGAIQKLGYGFAYRILDAQYFGVPQRRRRVFVIGYLGDWRPAAAVLFESESLCGNTKTSRKKRQEVANSTGDGIVGSLQARDYKGVGNQYVNEGKLVSTLESRQVPPAVAFDQYNYKTNGNTFGSHTSGLGTAQHNLLFKSQVRRLTPKECERLQGFPDNYTLLPDHKADGERYKALGNSMAVPVMRWIGNRIQQVQSVINDLA